MWGKTADSTKLDPAVITDGESVTVTSNLFDGLVALKEGGSELIPWLATSWETSKDGLQTFPVAPSKSSNLFSRIIEGQIFRAIPFGN